VAVAERKVAVVVQEKAVARAAGVAAGKMRSAPRRRTTGARAAAAAEETARSEEVGQLGLWSGRGETPDELASHELRQQLQAWRYQGTMASTTRETLLQSLRQEERVVVAPEVRAKDAAVDVVRSEEEQIDDINSAAALVDSYMRVANSAAVNVGTQQDSTNMDTNIGAAED